jgi:hypothetical protein
MCFSAVWEGYTYSQEMTWVHRIRFKNTLG